ncbi:MAG: hypothetical protein AMS16_06805 [Planctomycetes bacterium DG_58]|nr:MAG: hypothetical protein AMS16_06805 [Planctomycetes bacterium DG_58]KPL01935.1 MAG: hypothetical protein AMK75_03420 [Planctomycetes bacterium SM23_65]
MSEEPQGEAQEQPTPEQTPAEGEGQPPAAEIASEAKTFAMLCHLTGIFLGFIGPLIFWLIKKDEHPLVDDQGKEALNFQLTILICFVAAFVLIFVLVGFLLVPAVWVFDVVMSIIGTVEANKGNRYRYPVCIRFLK